MTYMLTWGVVDLRCQAHAFHYTLKFVFLFSFYFLFVNLSSCTVCHLATSAIHTTKLLLPHQRSISPVYSQCFEVRRINRTKTRPSN